MNEEDDYEYEPSQAEIDEEYNRQYWLETELAKAIKENKKIRSKYGKKKVSQTQS